MSFDDDSMYQVRRDTDGTPTDAELITAVRAGDEQAFATLWRRHEAAALRLARQISNPNNAEDLVSESFVRLLRVLRQGEGPDGAFRPYLFSTLRRLNIDNARSYTQRVSPTGDHTELEREPASSAADVAAVNAEHGAAWRAWASLPDSSRTLLWHLVVEEETPAQIAPLIGTSPNGVSSRAVRARERLRQAFLQQHVAAAVDESCWRTRSRLGEYVRDALSARDRSGVQAHLDECCACQSVLFEIADVNQTLRAVIAPIVLGGVGLAAYAHSAAHSAGSSAKAHVVGRHLTSRNRLGRRLTATRRRGALIGAAVVAVGAIAAAATSMRDASSPTAAGHAAGAASGTTTPAATSHSSSAVQPEAPRETVTTTMPGDPKPLAPAGVAVTPSRRPSSTSRTTQPPTPSQPRSSQPTTTTPTPATSPIASPSTPGSPTTAPTTVTPPALVRITGQPHYLDLGTTTDPAANATIDITVPGSWQLTAVTIDPSSPSGWACTLVDAQTARCVIDPPAQQSVPYAYTVDLLGPADDHSSVMTIRCTNGTALDDTITPVVNPGP